LGFTKTVRIGKTPVKFMAEVHYSIIRPETYSTEWNFVFRAARLSTAPLNEKMGICLYSLKNALIFDILNKNYLKQGLSAST